MTVLVVAALVLIVAIVAAPVWPGVFTPDSVVMWQSGPRHEISDQYAPVLQWLWGGVSDMGVGPWAGLVFGLVVVVAGLYGVYTLWMRPWPAVAATLFTVLFPSVYGFLGWVGRDVWFAGLLLCTLAFAGRVRTGRPRPVVLAGMVVCAWLAADARQNGFPVLSVAAAVAAYVLLARRRRRRQAWFGAAIAALVVAPASLLLVQRAVIDVDRHPEQPLLYQDLLSVSLRLGRSQLSPQVFPSQDLARVRQTWSFGSVGQTIFPPDAPVRFDMSEHGGAVSRVLAADWSRMVRRHPVTYLGQRARLALRQLGVGAPSVYPYFAGSAELGIVDARLRQRWPAGNRARLDYLRRLGVRVPESGFPYTVWPYLLLGCGAAVAIAWRSARLRLFAASALVLQLALQVVLFFTAVKLEFRYEAFQVMLGVVLVIMLGSVLVGQSREQMRADAA